MKYIEHTVAEMDESLVQHCVKCAEVIVDYRNCAWQGDAEIPKGWGAGSIFVSDSVNPKIFTRTIGNDDVVIDCMNPFQHSN